jgi:hypothetical protein
MNERMARASPGAVAEFIAAFEEGPGEAPRPRQGALRRVASLLGRARGAGGGGGGAAAADPTVWLVWRDEKGPTLWDLMQAVGLGFAA